MAKRGRKPQGPYITMWKEVVEGVRRHVKKPDSSGTPAVWELYPTGKTKPYFGRVHKGDLLSERRALAKFLRWKAEQDGTPWEGHLGDDAFADAAWLGMLHSPSHDLTDRRVERLAVAYASKYRDFIRDLIRNDPRKAAAELEIEELAWLDRLGPPSTSMSLTDIGELYFSQPDLSDHWKRKMERMWKEFVRFVDVATVRDVTREQIVGYRSEVRKAYEKDKSPTYVVHRFGCIKAFLRHAVSEADEDKDLKYVLKLCVKLLKPPRKRGVDPEPISRKHFRKLLEAVESEPKWKALLLLSLNAALYPSEVAAVKKVHLDLDKRTLNMHRSKTGLPRLAVLWPRTVEAIREYQAAAPHDSEYVFVSQTGAPYTDNHISRNFCRRRDAIGLPKRVKFAHIRDGSYTAAVEADGVEVKHARVLAGHRSGMDDHYVKRVPRLVTAACEAVEQYYFGDPSTSSSGDSG